MTDFISPTPLDRTGAVCALRKVAVLAHWVPGVGVTISQAGRPSVRVAAFWEPSDGPCVDLDPCSFRRGLVQWLGGDEHGLAHLIEPDDGVVIRVVTDETTKVSEHGLVLHRMGPSVAVVAFASLIEPETCHHVGCASGGSAEPPTESVLRVDFERDEDLGVTLVHTTVDPNDPIALQEAHDVLLELSISYGATETVDQFEAMDGG